MKNLHSFIDPTLRSTTGDIVVMRISLCVDICCAGQMYTLINNQMSKFILISHHQEGFDISVIFCWYY